MKTFLAKCQANIAHYEYEIAEEIHQSNGGKKNGTAKFRQNHYLDWCSWVNPGQDPFFPDQPFQVQNYLIVCFVVSWTRWETI